MKIILLKDVKKQGKKGDIIEVASGYGTFLINKNEAVLATSGSINRLSKENAEKALNETLYIKELEKLKQKIEKICIEIPVKTGAADRVFGSVSSKQIANECKKREIDIDKKKIECDHEIASLGCHNVKINLHKKVVANLKIKLVKER